MKSLIYCYLLMIHILAGSSLAVAEISRTLSWQDCLKEAQQSNPELQGAKRQILSSVYQEGVARSGFFPQVSVGLNYNYGLGLSNTGLGTTNIVNVSNTSGGSSSYSVSTTVSQNLFTGLQDLGRMNQAAANTEISRANLDTTRARVSFELKSAFASLGFAQKSLQLARDIILRRESNFRLVSLRFDSGRENKGSVLLSKAYLEQAHYDYLLAQNSLTVSQAQLARVLGRDLDTGPLAVTGELPLSTPPNEISPKELALLLPSYRLSQSQEEVAEASVVLARSQFFPALNLTGALSRTGSEWFPQNQRWSVGAGISFPIFTGGRDYYTLRSASENLKASTLSRENTLRQGVTQLSSSFAAFREAIQKLEMDRSFVEAANIRAKISKERYNNGLLSFEDWDIIENDLINRRKVFLQSQRDRSIAEAAWEQAQGKGVIE